ncbi:MAG: nickel-dependent hydrogenase large subunit [Candidatus Obscuribacterales bacterium]|nr:nickel-dependent hydrogenase large subunit [Candidatus Obscuribacterales bacterium]
MAEIKKSTIVIPEVTRVEGHSAVTVDILDGKVENVKLDVFEGTRYFEKIVVGHKYDEMAHLTSRICAICSTGHVLASIFAIENLLDYKADEKTTLLRELMHLGMIIESHATHLCALVLPDFLGVEDLIAFADKHKEEFALWTFLRTLGNDVQYMVGGRSFHPVNLHVFKLSSHPGGEALKAMAGRLKEAREKALFLAQVFLDLKLPAIPSFEPEYLALDYDSTTYGYFGTRVKSSQSWLRSIEEYRDYLGEYPVAYSHAKKSGNVAKPFMVGAIARLRFHSEKLGREARQLFLSSDLAKGSCNTMLNNLAQSIELVDAVYRAQTICEMLGQIEDAELASLDGQSRFAAKGGNEMDVLREKLPGAAVGAVECPRGTLYHYYDLDEKGLVRGADLITPSAQNTQRIESDIRNTVEARIAEVDDLSRQSLLQSDLETLVRAYDPCNTCATHAVTIRVEKR